MCDFCKDKECVLTKEQALERGSLLELSAAEPFKVLENGIQTYVINDEIWGRLTFSALIPDPDSENPHSYIRYACDEEGNIVNPDDIKDWRVGDPMLYQLEKDFLSKEEE
ncbi:hypothetical protein M2146_001179 [Lachnospiraceae bacterium PF1-22]